MKLRNHPQVEMVRLSELEVSKTHARKHDKKTISKIAESQDRFGFLVPIIVDDTPVGGKLVIAAGAGRYYAAQMRGLEDVPVIRAKFLSEADRRAFSLADNKLAEFSTWDPGLVVTELEFLFEQNYDLSVTGFTINDLNIGVGGQEEDDVEEPDPDATAVSRLGDLWHIGPHSLYNGNARDAASYESLLGGELADMIIGDPPFNVKVDGHVGGLGKVKHREFVEASGEMTPSEFIGFLRQIFRMCVRFSRDGSMHFFFMDWRHIVEIMDASTGVFSGLKALLVWVKSSGGMGSLWRSRHELVFVFKAGSAPHINNVQLGANGRNRTNVLEYPGANVPRKGRMADLEAHPTVKPAALYADLMLDCSHPGDLVLDPCAGSGTVFLAADRTKRRGAGIELDPLYVDTAIRRLTKATGLVATLSDGRSFDRVAKERAEAQE